MRICLSHSRLFLRAGQRENSCRPTNYFSLPGEQIFISPLTMQRYKIFVVPTNIIAKKTRKKTRTYFYPPKPYNLTILQPYTICFRIDGLVIDNNIIYVLYYYHHHFAPMYTVICKM